MSKPTSVRQLNTKNSITQLVSRINSIIDNTNQVYDDLGNIAALTTTSNNAASALNEIFADLGDMDYINMDQTGGANANVVACLNSINTQLSSSAWIWEKVLGIVRMISASPLNMQNENITNLNYPDNNKDSVNKAYLKWQTNNVNTNAAVAINNTNVNMKAYVDAVNSLTTENFQSFVYSANSGMQTYVDTANTLTTANFKALDYTINGEMQSYVDGKATELYSNNEAETTNLINYINTERSNLIAYTDGEIDTEATNLINYVNTVNTDMKAYVDDNIHDHVITFDIPTANDSVYLRLNLYETQTDLNNDGGTGWTSSGNSSFTANTGTFSEFDLFTGTAIQQNTHVFTPADAGRQVFFTINTATIARGTIYAVYWWKSQYGVNSDFYAQQIRW